MSLSFPASPALNQVYQGWIWNGASWDPNYASNFVTSINGQKGAVTGFPQLIQTLTVANALMCSFSLPAAYRRFQIHFDNMVTFAASSNGIVQLSNNNGSTWDNAADYNWTTTFVSTLASNNTSSNGATGGLAQTAAYLFGAIDMSTLSTAAYGIIDFTIGGRCQGVARTYLRSNAAGYTLRTGWENPILANPNAIRLCANSGNVTVSASLYGYPS